MEQGGHYLAGVDTARRRELFVGKFRRLGMATNSSRSSGRSWEIISKCRLNDFSKDGVGDFELPGIETIFKNNDKRFLICH